MQHSCTLDALFLRNLIKSKVTYLPLKVMKIKALITCNLSQYFIILFSMYFGVVIKVFSKYLSKILIL